MEDMAMGGCHDANDLADLEAEKTGAEAELGSNVPRLPQPRPMPTRAVLLSGDQVLTHMSLGLERWLSA